MASTTMEQSQSQSQSRRRDEQEFSLREWKLKSQMISRENTKSRRFSGSHIRSFREEDAAMSFRSNFTISSTASSPGYSLREEIDPSTYSFSTALKALQARSIGGYSSWECLSPDGFALNSKWNEAEKYISNPLSGEVPMECLSAKTLSGRSFRNRITMSAPLVYHNSSRQIHAKPPFLIHDDDDDVVHLPIQEKKVESSTRDVGTQSTPPELSSSSPSPSSTPPIVDRVLKRCGTLPNCNAQLEVEEDKVQVKETIGKEETKKRAESNHNNNSNRGNKDGEQMWRCSSNSSRRQGGCLSWIMRKRQREKHKARKKNIFLVNLQGC